MHVHLCEPTLSHFAKEHQYQGALIIVPKSDFVGVFFKVNTVFVLYVVGFASVPVAESTWIILKKKIQNPMIIESNRSIRIILNMNLNNGKYKDKYNIHSI